MAGARALVHVVGVHGDTGSEEEKASRKDVPWNSQASPMDVPWKSQASLRNVV